MAAEKEVGKIYNSIEFRIDSKSWKNLDKFQKRIENVKKQLKGLGSEVNSISKTDKLFKGSKRKTSRPSTSAVDPLKKEQEAWIKDMRKRQEVTKVAGYRQDTMLGGSFVQRAGAAQIQLARNNARKLFKEFESGDMTVSMFRAKLARINTELKEAARNTKTWWEQLKSAKTVMAGFAVAGAWQAGDAIMRTGQGFETMEAAMLKASGSMKAARKDLQFVADIAQETGANLQTATSGFTKLAVSARGVMSNKALRDLFEGYTKYSVSVGTDQFRYEKGLFALGQIMNKGTLMAEEVKNQLGEQVVGSMRVFSDALGMDTKSFLKAMESGKLLAEDVLPLVGQQFLKSANEGGAYTKMINTNRVAMDRMKLSFQLWMKEVFEGGFKDGLTEVFNGLNKMATALLPVASILGELTGSVLVPLGKALQIIASSISYVGNFFSGMPDWLKKIFSAIAVFLPLFRIMKYAFKGASWLAKGISSATKGASVGSIVAGGISTNKLAGAAALGLTGVGMANKVEVEVTTNTEGVEGLVDTKINSYDRTVNNNLTNDLGG